jgi:hypothetical protein
MHGIPDAAIGWIALVGAIAAGRYLWRGGGGAALQTLTTANNVLERRIHELEERIDELEELRAADRDTIAMLSDSRDFSLAMQPIIRELQAESVRNQKRFEGTMQILELIAKNCGPEPAEDHAVLPIRKEGA